MIGRRKTRVVKIGSVKIGYGHHVAIQSMTKTHTTDIASTVEQIRGLEDAGCEMIRVAVKDMEDARAIKSIKEEITIPVIADIHFDHKLALQAIKSGADKIRVNPGNIGSEEDLDRVIDAAASAGIPIRIGVNSGSLPEEEEEGGPSHIADRMVHAALKCAEHFDKRGFNDLVISLKASQVPATVKACRRIAEECDYPLHLGITAAGLPADGVVRSCVGIGALLLDGIGDTIRVSLTGDPRLEVDTARRILSASGVRHFGPQLIACPTCGRCQVDLVQIVMELEEELLRLSDLGRTDEEKQLVIAVMGCEVNGPGEAKDADIGIAFGKGKGVIFKHGEIVRTVDAGMAIKELLKMIKEEK